MTFEYTQTLLLRDKFKLTGSRRMNEKFPEYVQINEQTDWDYYSQYDESKSRLLELLGFEIKYCMISGKGQTSYCDDLVVQIWKHPIHPIDAILRSNAALYEKNF